MDQITGTGADDMRAEDAVCFLVGDQLDEAFAREDGLGTGVAHKAEFADLIGAARFFQLLFGGTDIGNLGVGIDHAGDHAIVHVAMFACHDLCCGHAFVFGLMRQHRAFNDVADSVDAFDRGFPGVAYRDLAAFGQLDPQTFKAQTVVERLAAGGDENDIGVQRVFAVILAQLVGHLGFGLGGFGALNGSAHDKVDALLFQDTHKVLLDFAIHAGGDRIEIFDNRHLGPQTRVDRAEFEPDDARADHDQLFRDLVQRQRAGGGDDDLFVNLDTGKGRGFGPCGDDDVLGLVDLVTDLDLASFGDGGPAFDPVDLVLLEQELDPLGVGVDRVLFVGLHLRPIDRRAFALEAHIGKVVFGFVQHMRGMQQRLGRDTADVQAGAAQRLAALDTGGFEAQLGAADGGYIAAGAGADDDDIVAGHGRSPWWSGIGVE